MTARKQRSDAQQNRERILWWRRRRSLNPARVRVSTTLQNGPVSGLAPLYRHFPSREALLKAVYEAAAEKLAASATEFAGSLPPIDALRAWMMLFVDYVAEKQIIAPALDALIDEPRKVYEASYGKVWEAVRGLVKRAVKSGDIREDLDAVDLLRALVGVASIGASADWQQRARKLVDILILGSRPVT